MAEYTITVSGPTTLTVTYIQGFAVEPFESTGQLSATLNQAISAGMFENTGALSGKTNQSISAGGLESTGTMTGDFWVIDFTGLIVLYKFVLSGAEDATIDVEIPISSFQLRMYADGLSYLNVVIPDGETYSDAITDRPNGTLNIYLTYADPDSTEVFRVLILVTAFDSVSVDEGSAGKTITISGNETTAQKNIRIAEIKAITIDEPWVNYRRTANGKTTLRLSKPHFLARAGDTITHANGSFTASLMTWYESGTSRTIELSGE